MATLLWQREFVSDVYGVKTTYSSWHSCMTKAYCKWPVIIGIIIGSLVVFSIVWCLARCLCCGVECCCGVCACCNACCPSPRGRGGKQRNDGYYRQNAPPPLLPPQSQPYPQYQSPAPPQYGYNNGGGYRGAQAVTPQTATFDVPSKRKNVVGGGGGNWNEDALPAMPSWEAAQSRRVEQEEDVELEKLDHPEVQQAALLPEARDGADDRYYNPSPHSQYQQDTAAGDMGTMNASPYHDYNQHRQYSSSLVPTAHNSGYPPTYHSEYTSPTSTVYEPPRSQWPGQSTYAPSLPPSYHTGPPIIAGGGATSPPPMNRNPVQGSWRDI